MASYKPVNDIKVWMEIDGQKFPIAAKDIQTMVDSIGSVTVRIDGYMQPMAVIDPWSPGAAPTPNKSWTPDDGPTPEMKRKNKKT